jgi:hypothetical protein
MAVRTAVRRAADIHPMVLELIMKSPMDLVTTNGKASALAAPQFAGVVHASLYFTFSDQRQYDMDGRTVPESACH